MIYMNTLHFYFILITCIIFKKCDFYNNIIINNNQCLFFQVFSMHINFSIQILLTYFSGIVS